MNAVRSQFLKALPFVAALALVAAPASAHFNRGHGHKKHKQQHEHRHSQCLHHSPARAPNAWGWHGPAVRSQLRSFEVPTVIVSSEVPRLREWRHGYVYDPVHRHRHAVYAFPVLDHGAWVAQPHAYCDGHLLSGHLAHAGPGFRVALGFGF